MTSVLANFICDACVGDDLTVAAHREITDHVESLHRFSQTNPGTRIVIAPPLPRSSPEWFQAFLPGFSSFLYHEITRMCNPNLKFMSPFVAPPSFFEADGLHLNSDAGLSFVHYLVSNSDLLYPPEMGNSIEASMNVGKQNQSGPSSAPLVTQSAAPLPSLTLSGLAQDVSVLRSEVKRRRLQDNLLFARIKEDRDHEKNRSREDRCTLSGVKVTTPPPIDPRERKEFFKALISELVAEACPSEEERPQVADVLVNMRQGRGPPCFEVKFNSIASSLKFRVAAAKLAKEKTGSFDGLFVSNTVNLSTRIRIDILKLLAKCLTTSTEICYVQGFSSRPTLHYRVREADPDQPPPVNPSPMVAPGTGRSYTFTEGVERWGHLLSPQSLSSVRRKAYQAFHGCLEQYFVVLSDQTALDPVDSMFSRLAGQAHPTVASSSRGRRPWRQYGRNPVRGAPRGPARGPPPLTGANAWAQYDSSFPSISRADSVPASDRGNLKRSAPGDMEVGTPTKKKPEDWTDSQ